jgi:hypothetical protein
MTPGRIAALAIGVPVVLAIVGFTSFNFVADLGQASFPVSYGIPVSDHHLTAQVDGNITLRQAQVSTAELKGTARYSLFRPAVTQNGNTVSFNCRFQFGNCSLNATLVVPEQTAMSVSTKGGDVSLGNYAGDLTLNTDGGNLTADSLTGDLQFSTGGGDVNAGALNAHGPLRLTTDGGNIDAQAVVASTTVIQSGGGDVSLRFTQAPAKVQITSDGGNVTLVLPHGDYAFDTNADGGNDSHPADGTSPTSIINVQSGGGDINITAAS